VRRIEQAAIAVLALTLIGTAAQAGSKQARKGEADFRAAWLAFAGPAGDPEKSKSLEARQQARIAAIPLMEAAVVADPKNWAYQESLAYIRLSAGQYEKAKAAVARALDLKRDRPLLYLLRGQAEAALAQMDPPHAGERIGPAMAAFDRAAALDKQNALPLLQAASVALDLNRPDLAMERVRQALQRPGSMLYSLTVPVDLYKGKGESVRAWQYVQLGHWFELLARFRNISKALLAQGRKHGENGDLGAAEEQLKLALQVGRQVGEMQPHLFICVAEAIDLMQDAYFGLAHHAALALIRRQAAAIPGQMTPADDLSYRGTAKLLIRQLLMETGITSEREQAVYQEWQGMDPAPVNLEDSRWSLDSLAHFYVWLMGKNQRSKPKEALDFERWHGEAGVLAFARNQLAVALNTYVGEITKSATPSVPELLAFEAKVVSPVIAGIGLKPRTGNTRGGEIKSPGRSKRRQTT